MTLAEYLRGVCRTPPHRAAVVVSPAPRREIVFAPQREAKRVPRDAARLSPAVHGARKPRYKDVRIARPW